MVDRILVSAPYLVNPEVPTIIDHIWRGRPPKVETKTICQDIKDGAMKAIDENLLLQKVTKKAGLSIYAKTGQTMV